MDKLFERHDQYLSCVPMKHIRSIMHSINWNSRLIVIKGSKGVGKSTLIQQYIKKHFNADDRHVLYCSADSTYFSTHSLIDTADQFAKLGGKFMFIDEVHKYKGWSREIKEIYDLYKEMHIVISGSSLIQMNDGQSDLSRRIIEYYMPGLSMREFLMFDQGIESEPITLNDLLSHPSQYCNYVRSLCHPIEVFQKFLHYGYYPFYFEEKSQYVQKIENVINYIIDVELTKYRSLEVGNTRAVKALMQVISQMVPYEIDISKLSRSVGISRQAILKYLKYMEEAELARRLYTNLSNITDLQKPDKLYMHNTNILYALSNNSPDIGTVRETFLFQQLVSTEHVVEYAGYKQGDFRVDKDIVIEVGGPDKGFKQIKEQTNAFVAADGIDTAINRKIPLWAFGFLY